MSKTVKRVMTVTMIGLVAMLGAKAEAHTRWFNGIPRTCSTCGHGTLEEVPDPTLPTSHPAVAEFFVTTKEVRIECNDGSIVTLKGKNTATLVARTLSTSKNWVYKNGTAEVEFFDKGESDKLFANLGFCSERNPLFDVQILRMSARFEASECLNADCSASVLTSTMKLNDCTVRRDAPKGTPYDCKKRIIEHVHPIPGTRPPRPDETDGPNNDGSFDD